MSGELAKYHVVVPTLHTGTVLGHLSSIGGWLDGLSDDAAGRSTISARLPVEAIPDLKNVLAKLVQGEVQVIADQSANDEDA